MDQVIQSTGTTWRLVTARLEGLGAWLAPLGLRLILAWEFGEAGFEKLRGSNWFGQVQEGFPLPFSLVSTDVSWFMATWAEIIGAFALMLGLFTRFFAFSLLILTIVATAALHWPDSWSLAGVAFGLPLAMLFPAFGLVLVVAGIAGIAATLLRGARPGSVATPG